MLPRHHVARPRPVEAIATAPVATIVAGGDRTAGSQLARNAELRFSVKGKVWRMRGRR